MLTGNPAGIVLTTPQWFEECLARGCTVFHFPPGSKRSAIGRLGSGSICIVLARPAPKTPRGEWVFLGEFTVRSVELVSGEEFQRVYASRAIEVEGGVGFPRPGEKSWVIEFEGLTKYPNPVRLGDCRHIKTSTSKKPLSEWRITGFSFIKPEDAANVVDEIRGMAGALSRPPAHSELIEELSRIGEWLGFIVRKEEYTPDQAYKIDVTWRDAEAHRPLKAFEVEMSRDVDSALSRLTHVHDLWGSEQLWLIVGDEAISERARRLVEPRLRGSFARIRDKLVILGWRELHNFYINLEPHRELLKRMAKR